MTTAARTIEITDGNRLVATFEIDDAALALMVRAGIKSPQEFASKAVITVRNAELPFNLVDDYRVTMNGPPPGPGLIMRYGSARFSEGSRVMWEPGPPKLAGSCLLMRTGSKRDHSRNDRPQLPAMNHQGFEFS